MSLSSSPSWLFISHKGKTRKKNKDMFALIHSENITLVLAFDISTSSPVTTKMLEVFIDEVKNNVDKSSPSTIEDVEQSLQLAFSTVKSEFKIGKASVLAICAVNSQKNLFCLHAGDVRLGQYLKAETIQWITNVHTGANPLGQFFEANMLQHESRHIVTRCLNLQRILNLDKTELELSGGHIIIASDGFWAECSDEEQQRIVQGEWLNREDDCSAIVLTWNKENTLPNNNHSNLIVK